VRRKKADINGMLCDLYGRAFVLANEFSIFEGIGFSD
jgi:hypothetical protein